MHPCQYYRGVGPVCFFADYESRGCSHLADQLNQQHGSHNSSLGKLIRLSGAMHDLEHSRPTFVSSDGSVVRMYT